MFVEAFTLLMNNYTSMSFFGEKSENRGKLILSGATGQHTENWDYPDKIGTVEMFAMFFLYGVVNTRKHFYKIIIGQVARIQVI